MRTISFYPDPRSVRGFFTTVKRSGGSFLTLRTTQRLSQVTLNELMFMNGHILSVLIENNNACLT